MIKMKPATILSGTILTLGFLLTAQPLLAQGPLFSQPYATPIRTNPALMGTNEDIHFGLGYRSKWGGFQDGYQTPRFTFMMPAMVEETSKLDLGLSILQDQAGAFTDLSSELAVSYDLQLSSSGHRFSAALKGGFNQSDLAREDLTFDEQYQNGSFNNSNSANEANLQESTSYIDVGFGLLRYYNPEQGEDEGSSKTHAFAGFSGSHMNEPDASYIDSEGDQSGSIPRLYQTIGGVKFLTDGAFSFTPNIRMTEQSGTREFASGIYTGYDMDESTKLSLGVWYKEDNSVAVSVGGRYSGFTLGYSYDLATSSIRNQVTELSLNTHEISLSYDLDQGEDQFGPSPLPLF